MNKARHQPNPKAGSVLLTAAIFLGIAVLTLISILVATSNYTRVNFRAYEYERAFQLADAGIRATVLDLNSGLNGGISTTRGRSFFATTNAFRASNWGFSTTITNLATDRRRVVSVGLYDTGKATVSAEVRQSSHAQSIHSLFAHAIYAGNSSHNTNYVLRIGGIGTQADRVVGDVYSGNDLELSGNARLPLAEAFVDANANGIYDEGEVRYDAGSVPVHAKALTPAEYAAYVSSMSHASLYPNGQYDSGEAFVDTIGNGIYDPGEGFSDVNGDGTYGFGEPFIDADGDGELDSGESFVDHGNGNFDSGEAFEDLNGNGHWDAAVAAYTETVTVKGKKKKIDHPAIPAEPFEDLGNNAYDPGETFVDRNGVYDSGESYFDDRNGRYDYGSQATRNVSGMPAPGAGQTAATGHNPAVLPPNLDLMYYSQPKSGTAPTTALNDWGSDVAVAKAPFDNSGRVLDKSNPSHIFVKNPKNRSYTPIPGKNDYFIEDPSDASYGKDHQYLTVTSNGNDKVYYVDGNVYLHNPDTHDFKFRQPGVKITIVANGNITISDEFWYNGGVANPSDSLALIAKKDPAVANSGNIYLGDAQFGTGGDIHAMLYADNNFVDNNLNGLGQPYLSVFGTMSAGNLVNINRSGLNRTRLDVTLDERIAQRRNLPPGLPQALNGQRNIAVTGAWEVVRGTWRTHSNLSY